MRPWSTGVDERVLGEESTEERVPDMFREWFRKKGETSVGRASA